jgi:hypothetical protein
MNFTEGKIIEQEVIWDIKQDQHEELLMRGGDIAQRYLSPHIGDLDVTS